MGSSSAERQRRYRAHKRGDHSLCDPDRCRPDTATVTPGVTPPVTRDAVTPTAPELGTRGRRLWRQVTGDGSTLEPGELVLLEESCRIADRLDQLDRILGGDAAAWMRFAVNDDGTEVTVVIDKVLAETRQQQTALKQLLAELRQSRAARVGKPGSSRQPGAAPKPSGGEGVAGVADLTARIAARSAGTSG